MIGVTIVTQQNLNLMAGELQNIFDGIYSAVVHAQKSVEENLSNSVRDGYFNEDGTAKTVKMNLNNKDIEVPLFTLVPHNTLKIKSKMANVKIKFSSTDQAEGMARIGDNLIKLIPTI